MGKLVHEQPGMRWTDPVTARRVPSKWKRGAKGAKGSKGKYALYIMCIYSGRNGISAPSRKNALF